MVGVVTKMKRSLVMIEQFFIFFFFYLIVVVVIKLTCDKIVYNYKHIPASPVAQW